jgi:hypothetical protein
MRGNQARRSSTEPTIKVPDNFSTWRLGLHIRDDWCSSRDAEGPFRHNSMKSPELAPSELDIFLGGRRCRRHRYERYVSQRTYSYLCWHAPPVSAVIRRRFRPPEDICHRFTNNGGCNVLTFQIRRVE